MMTPHLLATCWTTAGDAEPYAGQGTNRELSPIPVTERIEQAASAGWKGFGIAHVDLVEARDTVGYPAMRAALADNGMEHVQLEFLNDWWTTGGRREASDRVRRDLLDAAAYFGAGEVKVAGNYAWGDPVDEGVMAEAFHQLCEDAALAGTRIALEPLPFSNFSTIRKGAEFVRTVGHPAGGIIVDVWHVFRSGTTIEELPEFLDPTVMFAVELNDALAAEPEDVWDDTIRRRRLCGRGEWDIPGFINAVRATGFTGPWGVEILSETQRKLPLSESLPEVFSTTMAAFREADARL